MTRWFVVLCAVVAVATPAVAQTRIGFDDAWREQGFLRLFTNRYDLNGDQLGISSNKTVSLLWRPVDEANWASRSARWAWRVDQGVPPTDLQQKGGDDRNIALYFVFVDEATARGLSRNTARGLLRHPNTRALVYVWGGDHTRGDVLSSPYHPYLTTHILRPAGVGAHRETVNLRADFRAAFGAEPGVLVGLAVSADSDDSRTKIRAGVSDLVIQ
ncbi:MAG: DUF3047 domain-containing protein [Primorskyibacter sp.]